MPTSITSSGITFDDATTLTTGVLTAANIASGAVIPAKLSQPLTLATSVASTSGTSIDFTGIPSWVRRITVMINGVSTNGSSTMLLRVGTGGTAQTIGYTSSIGASTSAPAAAYAAAAAGFHVSSMDATSVVTAVLVISTMGSNIWLCNGASQRAGAASLTGAIVGATTLSGALDMVRLTTVNGTDTFDAGSVNIIYEG
jgi:hypothetical protein